MKKILILGKLDDLGVALLKKNKNFSWNILPHITEDKKFLALLKNANALLVRSQKISPEWIEICKNLEIISRHGVGIDNLPMEKINAKKIPVCIIEDVNSICVAEHTIALLLHCTKQLSLYQKNLLQGNWKIRDSGLAGVLYQKTILLIGCGKIGERIVERLLAFGMKILIYDPYRKKNINLDFSDNLGNALVGANFVIVCCSKTKETTNILNSEKLRLLPRDAIVINAARGGLVDENALYEMLKKKEILAAGFDVFNEEPPSPNSPLFTLENFFATGHIASKTKDCIQNTAISAVENIFAFFLGKLNTKLIINAEIYQ